MLANGFAIFLLLSSGYLVTDLGDWVAWLRWISPYFYGESPYSLSACKTASRRRGRVEANELALSASLHPSEPLT